MESFKRQVAKFIMVVGMIILGVSVLTGVINMCLDKVTFGLIILFAGALGGMLLSCIGVIADHLADIKDILVSDDEEEGSEA